MSEAVERFGLPEGYKEVQFGPKTLVVPSDWSAEQFGDVFYRRRESIDEIDNETVKYVGLKHLDSGQLDINGYGVDGRERSSSRVFREGDVLFGKLRPNLNKAAIAPFDGVCSSDIIPIYAEEDAHQQYLPYLMHSKLVRDRVVSTMEGTNLPRTSWDDLETTLIPLPSIPEQHLIADILSTVDEQIQQTDEMIEKASDLKQGLMQDLLITGIGHDRFQRVDFGPESIEIPASWKKATLEDVIDRYRGGASLSSKDFTEEGVPVVPKGGINQRGVLQISEENQQYCSKEYADSNESSLVTGGDLVTASRDLVSSAPNIGRIVEVPDGTHIIAQGVNSIEPDTEWINPKFLIYLSNSRLYRNHMKRIKVGSTQVHIRKGDFLSTPIPYPPLEEQNKIVDVLSTAEQLIRDEKNRKSELQDLKRGFMQDLLTGEVRVNTD